MVITNFLSCRPFPLPQFELAPLDFEEERLTELAELLLDDPLSQASIASNVVAIHDADSCPGRMQARIERHLETRDAAHPKTEPITPAEELQQALADLRRSIG